MMNAERKSRSRRSRLACTGLFAALGLAAPAAFAECHDSTSGIVTRAPATSQSIVCDTSLPNPVTSSVQAVSPSSNVSVTIAAGATISLSLAAVRVDNLSTITNYGSVSTVGGNNAHGIYTNTASATIGYGNTLTNHSIVSTVGTSSIGMFARTRNATYGNTVINTGTIATSGANGTNNASGIRVEGLASSTVENSGGITATGLNGNGIEMAGPGTIANTGTVSSVQGCGILGSDLVSGNTYSGVTLNNTGTISGTSATGCAIRLGNGADTVVLGAGSALTGSIDGGGVNSPFTGADRLIFDGFVNNDFNNAITRFNLLQATGGANVALTAVTATGYTFDQVRIDAGSALAFRGSQTFASFTNSGSLDLRGTAAGTHLTVGSYTGGGAIHMNTTLETGQPTDRLIVTGTVSGSTALHIASLGGAGVPAGDDGILIVDASSATLAPGAAFTLAAPPPTAGGKTYALYQGGLAGGNLQNWYLRPAALPPALAAAVPTLNPAALALLALALGWLGVKQRKPQRRAIP